MAQNKPSKLRITAGSARGTKLVLSPAVRPMPSRMKQALFNMLGSHIRNAVILDLFAGSGSLGIEALSRGARSAVFVEKNRRLRPAIETNIENAGVAEKCSVMFTDAYRICDLLSPDTDPFSIIFMDPPYLQSENKFYRRKLGMMLVGMAQRGISDPAAVITLHVRASAAEADDLPPELEVIDSRRYGSGLLIICRLKKTLAHNHNPLVELTEMTGEEDPECRTS